MPKIHCPQTSYGQSGTGNCHSLPLLAKRKHRLHNCSLDQTPERLRPAQAQRRRLSQRQSGIRQPSCRSKTSSPLTDTQQCLRHPPHKPNPPGACTRERSCAHVLLISRAQKTQTAGTLRSVVQNSSVQTPQLVSILFPLSKKLKFSLLFPLFATYI